MPGCSRALGNLRPQGRLLSSPLIEMRWLFLAQMFGLETGFRIFGSLQRRRDRQIGFAAAGVTCVS
jgi:hypothetical protein